MASESVTAVGDEVALEDKPLAMNVRNAGHKVVGIIETEEDALQAVLGEQEDVTFIEVSGPIPDATHQLEWAQLERDELISRDTSNTMNCLASASWAQFPHTGACS